MDTPANPSIDTPCTASFLMLSSHSTVFICLIFSCLCTGVANQHLDFGGVILGQHHGPLQISDAYVVTYDVKTNVGRWEEHLPWEL